MSEKGGKVEEEIERGKRVRSPISDEETLQVIRTKCKRERRVSKEVERKEDGKFLWREKVYQ